MRTHGLPRPKPRRYSGWLTHKAEDVASVALEDESAASPTPGTGSHFRHFEGRRFMVADRPVSRQGSGGLAPLRLQVRVEECEDAPTCILRRALVVARTWREYSEDRLQDGEREWILVSSSFVVIEKRVPGLRVLLDIVFDPDGRQCPLEAIGGPSQCASLAAVASDNRASLSQEAGRVCVLGSGAVVDTRHLVPALDCEQQGEPPSHAVADHADPSRAVLPGLHPDACRLDVVEGLSPSSSHVAHDRNHAGHHPSPREKVRRYGEVPFARKPVSLVP